MAKTITAQAGEFLETSRSALPSEILELPCGNINRASSRFFKLTKEAVSERVKYTHPSNVSGGRCVSKLGLLRNQNSDDRPSLRMPEIGEPSVLAQQPCRLKQLMTISQIVESSKGESFAWANVNGLGQFSASMESAGFKEHITLPLQRIKASKFQQNSNNDGNNKILRKCDLCVRCLLHRSPWSAQRLMVSIDLPIVSVLYCGHVFHADCLEKSIPNMLTDDKHDPLCPVCETIKNEIHPKAFLVNKLDGMREAIEPFRNKLAKTFSLKSWSATTKVPSGMKASSSAPHTRKGKGFLGKSLSRLQFHQTRAMKDSCSSQYPGSSRVSPDLM